MSRSRTDWRADETASSARRWRGVRSETTGVLRLRHFSTIPFLAGSAALFIWGEAVGAAVLFVLAYGLLYVTAMDWGGGSR